MNQAELNKILELHKKWLKNEPDGVRANLRCADLRETDLSYTDLRCADFRYANLSYAKLQNSNLHNANLSYANLSYTELQNSDLHNANLSYTDLSFAKLYDADLTYTDFRYADLHNANLHCADLNFADLRCADLSETNLRCADLSYTELQNSNLHNANLSGANLDNVQYNSNTAFFALQCPEKGSYIAYKKAQGLIVELEIPADALRNSATSRKCRASKAKVLSITHQDGSPANTDSVASNYNSSCVYKVGETVEVQNFDTDRWNEWSTGIHHFITREEAVQY